MFWPISFLWQRNSAHKHLPPHFDLRQFDQYYLPIDLRHCVWIATALFANSADVSVAKDRRRLVAHAENSGKRQPLACRNKRQGRTDKPFQGDLPDTSDFLLRRCVPAPLRSRSASSCPERPHAPSNLGAGGRAHDGQSKP